MKRLHYTHGELTTIYFEGSQSCILETEMTKTVVKISNTLFAVIYIILYTGS